MKSKIQVEEKHYFDAGYNDIFRFLSYQHQIEITTKLKPKTILEIGPGNGTYSTYLKKMGFDIKTCDIDKRLKPDYIGDILNLPVEKDKFDLVVAFEVLEHLPFEKFDQALNELLRVTKKNVIYSVPYPCFHVSGALKFPLINKLFKNQIPSFSLRIPKFYQTHSFDGEHYWELGKKNYSTAILRKHTKKYFKIIKQSHPLLNPYHEFFILERITNSNPIQQT